MWVAAEAFETCPMLIRSVLCHYPDMSSELTEATTFLGITGGAFVVLCVRENEPATLPLVVFTNPTPYRVHAYALSGVV